MQSFVRILPLAVILMSQAVNLLAATPQEDVVRARAFLTQLEAGKFAEAAASFDAEMSKALPADKLEQVWSGTTTMFGAFKEQAGARHVHQGEFRIVFVQMEHVKGPLEAKVVFDKADKIAGLFFAPPGSDAPPATIPSGVEEIEITVGSGEWKLPGTLALPKERTAKLPAVVLVQGSGPSDRNESIGAIKPFRDIAWGLASRGIAVVRYDKRTFVHRDKKEKLNAGLTVDSEVVDDAVAALALAMDRKEIDPARVFLAGHSLGGMLAPRIAERSPQVAGVILLAPGARMLHTLMIEQLEYITSLDGAPSGTDALRIEALKAQGAEVDTLLAGGPVPDKPILGAPASYWLSFKDLNPPAAAARSSKPYLVLHGDRDYQIRAADMALWSAALKDKRDAIFKEYSGLNHLFVAGKGPGRPAEYVQPGTVDAQVIEDMATFILTKYSN